MSVIRYELIGQIGVIRINYPPVNALGQTVRQGLISAVDAAQGDSSKALLILGEGRMFSAGADISEMGKPRLDPSLPEVLECIEQSAKPVIAAIHGSTMGGGLELTLCCNYRCAAPTARLGLPEVKLGLLPGAGGTQRVPRLTGIDAALDMMTGGRPMTAARALEIGLIDRLTGDDLETGALAWARELIADKAPLKRVRDRVIEAEGSTGVFERWRQKLARRSRGQIAPGHIVSCVEATINSPFDEGLALERRLFIECMDSSQSKAMRHMFFAQRLAARVEGLGRETPVRDIRQVAIIGAGTMGGGIAMNFANAGIPVTMLEISDEALQRGLDTINTNYRMTVKKGRMSETDMQQSLALIGGVTQYDALGEADLVIEAVFENLDVKREVFGKLDQVCKPGAILATNTSYQDVNRIAAATHRPEDVIGLHFFSPANIMKLLEVVRADETADDVIASCMKMARRIGKIPVLAGVCYGFIGNRMLRYYARQAQLCLVEGGSPGQVDGAMEKFGMAMGPLAVGDLAGLDIGYMARQSLSDEEKGDPRAYCIPDTLVEMGRLGQKSGSGFYRYDAATRARLNDPVVMEVVERQAAAQGVQRHDIADVEIVERLVFSLINEGARILEEGIAQRASDIDVVYVFGYGFPVARGGPMHYADSVGLKKIHDRICDFRNQYGEEQWSPAPLLKKLAREDRTFADWGA